jgi:hypothetical protein
MEKTLKTIKWLEIDQHTSFLITQTEENSNIISMSPWTNSMGHGVTSFDKDTAIKLANLLLDMAGGGNKNEEYSYCTDPECKECDN